MTARGRNERGTEGREPHDGAPAAPAMRMAVQQAEEMLAQQRARAALALDFAGWYSSGDEAVWTLGYYEGGAFCTVPGLSKSTLIARWFPVLHRRGITPHLTQAGLHSWVKVLPNAY